MKKRTAILGAVLGVLCAFQTAQADDTLVTSSTRCSGVAGYCTTTTTYWVYVNGQWVAQFSYTTRTPYTPMPE
jgi:hypothetical protein